ncbi:hypothetical protein DSM112329_00288 [Paraconexibacter sp. AEG42_29]|uniref:Uncharacterized protein n=1 Tax=Paraconexibacter sp. AEG42_29 TaxID=2997339 RepID=A0AAU7APA2_9ACTN
MNPQRLVRKPKPAPKQEVRPLAPETVEAMRGFLLNGVPRTEPAKASRA